MLNNVLPNHSPRQSPDIPNFFSNFKERRRKVKSSHKYPLNEILFEKISPARGFGLCHRKQALFGQKACDAKSNEITAIPQLLELIAIKGCIMAIDAMGCQKTIAEDIVKKRCGLCAYGKGKLG